MNSHHDKSRKKFRVPPLLVLLLVLAGFWWFFIKPDGLNFVKKTVPEPEPRAVIARGDLAQDEQNTIDVFKTTSPSVVYITSIELRRSLFSLNIYEIPQGTGSGFIWDKEGHIVTNYHVIVDANHVEVTLGDQSARKAVLVGVAPDKDIAVLKITAPAENLKPIPIGDANSLIVGQKVFAIGNPFGLDHTLTSGIVSALGREIKAATGRTIQGVIQTDAAINPGNSGGPLLDSAGRVIGVNTAIYSPSGASSGIGFAVPIDVVNRVVPEIIAHGHVVRPGIGVSIANDRISRRLGITGVLVISVQSGTSADLAGLRGTHRTGDSIILGDIIEKVNDKPITSYDDLRNELDRYHVGDTVNLSIIRDEKNIEIPVILERMR